MNCRRVINSISAYVDGELTGAEMLEIRRHLSECPDCSEEYESLRQIKFSVARLRTVVSPRQDLAACIVRRLDDVSIPPYQRALTALFRFAASKLSPVAAALTVAGVAIAILTSGGQDRMLNPAPEIVASAPLNLRVESASYVPAVPENAMMYSSSKPLVVADHPRAMTFSLANMSSQ